MGAAYERRGDDGQPAALVLPRDLQSSGLPVARAGDRRSSHDRRDLGGGRRGRHPAGAGPSEGAEPAARRRTRRRPGRGLPVRSSSSTSGATAAADFRSMLNRQSGNSSSSSAIVGTACSPPIRARRDLLRGELGQQPDAVGDPVEGLVVEGQQHAVAGGVHVGLEVVVAERDRVPEGVQGVLGAGDLGVQRTAAVGHRDHGARLVEDSVEIGDPVTGGDPPLGWPPLSREQYSPACSDGAPESPPGPSAFLLRSPCRTRGSTVRDMDEMTCPKCGGTMAERSHGRVTRPAVRVLSGRLPRPRRPRPPGRGRERLARPPLRRHRAAAADHARHDGAPAARQGAVLRRLAVPGLSPGSRRGQRSLKVSIWAPSSLSRSARPS